MSEKPLSSLFRDLLLDGQKAYRRAVAAQVEGEGATEEWDRWEQDTAALLLISWAEGAAETVRKAGVVPAAPPVTRFAKGIDEITLRFRSGPAREAIKRYIRLLPMTRERWEALIERAMQAAGELRADEQGNALERILARSPDLAALVNGGTGAAHIPEPEEPLPEAVKIRRTPAVQAAVQGSFFVTGMTGQQVRETKDLLAKAIRGEITTSVAGKRLQELGVGDFVEQSVLETGTDLTAARLETVYRTNINRAQSQGRLDICRDETVQQFVPLMRFRATKDKRTRETHKAMDGFVATVEQIDAMGIPTPLGFNCRCSWSPIPIAVAVSEGLCDEDGTIDYEAIRRRNGARQQMIDKGLVPDVGFISG